MFDEAMSFSFDTNQQSFELIVEDGNDPNSS